MEPLSKQYSFTKGRRTKRQRLSADGGGGFVSSYTSSTASASGTDDHDVMSEITTEEHDMANCLILLAQGIFKKVPEASRYDCKTCNKTFHSFQALGGHRASHKKPKPTSPPSPSPNPNPNEIHNSAGKKAAVSNKVHECSICGSEFPSGQALGGHMRRHRVPQANLSGGPHRNIVLSLDLNLPATDDGDHEDIGTTSFHRATPPLVDCHY